MYRLLLLLIGVLGLAGCGARQEFVVQDLVLKQQSWDSLTVQVAFAKRSALFGLSPATPAAHTVYLFDASYDTLYAGNDAVIPIPDYALGDRERLMVEVCGQFETMLVCDQQSLTASPKQFRLEEDIAFPEDESLARGHYNLRFAVERNTFDGEDWEPLPRHGAIDGYLKAYVGEAEAAAVQVPFTRTRGRFDLRRHANYDDFQYTLKSALHDAEKATVRFEVYAGLSGQPPVRVVSVDKQLRRKTPEERREEVQHFAEQAARELLERLGFDTDERQAWAFVDTWKYNQLANSYTVEMEITWRQRGRFFGGRYDVEGVLEVGTDGREASFHRADANDRARRIWRERFRDAVISLGALEPPEGERDQEEGTDARGSEREEEAVARVW